MNSTRPSSKSDRYAEKMVPSKKETLPEGIDGTAQTASEKSEKIRDAIRERLKGEEK